MNKIAIFVEGLTEQTFAEKLLIEIAGKKNINIDLRKFDGGKTKVRTTIQVKASAADSDKQYYALIVNCGTDNRVVSDIRENYEILSKDYASIIGIRDVYPEKREDIKKIRKYFYKQKTRPIKPLLVLAIMEIEAWFIAEHTHFAQIHNSLTTQEIEANLGFNPSTDDMEQLPHPAEDLHNIYQLVGLSYRKKKKHIDRTVDALDYARIYLELGNKFEYLEALINTLDEFFT